MSIDNATDMPSLTSIVIAIFDELHGREGTTVGEEDDIRILVALTITTDLEESLPSCLIGFLHLLNYVTIIGVENLIYLFFGFECYRLVLQVHIGETLEQTRKPGEIILALLPVYLLHIIRVRLDESVIDEREIVNPIRRIEFLTR